MRPEVFGQVVTSLMRYFRFVIVDTDPGMTERTLTVMDHATDLVLMAGTDITGLRALNKSIQLLDFIGITEPTRHVVLNRSNADVGVDIGNIAAIMGAKPDVLLPSHRSVPESTNAGIPVLLGAEPSPLVDPLWTLVNRFVPSPG